MSDILKRFLREECDSHIAGKIILDSSSERSGVRSYEFNLFELEINHDSGLVSIRSVIGLNEGDASSIEIGYFFRELEKVLKN